MTDVEPEPEAPTGVVAADPYAGQNDNTTPSLQCDLIKPSDKDDLPWVCKCLLIEANGNISFLPVDNADGDVVTITRKQGDVFKEVLIRRIMKTNTTCTRIYGGHH